MAWQAFAKPRPPPLTTAPDGIRREPLALVHLQLHRLRNRSHLGIIVLIDSRLKCPRTDWILGPQAELHCDRVSRSERVEVEDGLRRREAELRQVATLPTRALFLIVLQVFAEQVKPRRNAEIHHHHVG